jgi:putative sterol carrier protein
MSESALDQIRKVSHLAPFCDPLPKLIEPGSTDTATSVRRFGELLAAGSPVSVGLRLANGTQQAIHLRTDGDTADRSAPDLEIITSEGTWHRIASGQLEPMAAFIAGELRFRGDVAVANRVVRQLRGEK